MTLFKAGQKLRQSDIGITIDRYVSTNTTLTVPATATKVYIPYDTVQYATSNVTVSGTGNTTFQLNKSGLWIICTFSRVGFATNPTGGEWVHEVVAPTGTIYGSHSECAPINYNPVMNCRVMRQFSSGDQIQVALLNVTNQAATLAAAFELMHISLTWVQAA